MAAARRRHLPLAAALGGALLLHAIAGSARAQAPAAPASGGLDLERVIQLVQERNERAAQADARHEAAAARVDRARAFFFPDLWATGSVSQERGETGATPYGILGFDLVLFDARSIPLYRQASREEEAVRDQSSEDRRRLSFEAADAFLVTIGVEQVLTAAQRRVEYAQGSLQDAQARFAAGLAGSNDVTRAELELATSERALADARAGVETAYLQLGNLLDTIVAPPLVVPEALLDSAAVLQPQAESFVVAAQERRLDLSASRHHARALHASAQEPLLRAIPSFGLAATDAFSDPYDADPKGGEWTVGVQFAWRLYDGGERYAERAERLALARSADLDTKALGREVELQVRRTGVSLEQSQAAMLAASAALGAARKNAAEITELYRQGLARALEVADASVRLFEAEVGLASERYGLGRAFLSWRAALGLDPLGREP